MKKTKIIGYEAVGKQLLGTNPKENSVCTEEEKGSFLEEATIHVPRGSL